MKKMKLAFILILLIAFFQAAVVNPDKPLKGEWDFKLKKVWEIDRAGDDLLGKPFKLGGRGPQVYDCWGLCLELGKRVGLQFPEEFTPEDSEEQAKMIAKWRDKNFVRIEKPQAYCIVTMSIEMPAPFVDHCGFVLEDCKKFVHILRQHSVVRQRLDHRILKNKIQGFYKLREQECS